MVRRQLHRCCCGGVHRVRTLFLRSTQFSRTRDHEGPLHRPRSCSPVLRLCTRCCRGLRAPYLRPAVALILGFVGLKMLAGTSYPCADVVELGGPVATSAAAALGIVPLRQKGRSTPARRGCDSASTIVVCCSHRTPSSSSRPCKPKEARRVYGVNAPAGIPRAAGPPRGRRRASSRHRPRTSGPRGCSPFVVG